MMDVIEDLANWRRTLWKPLPIESVSEWCERNLVLGVRQTEAPGRFSLSSRPYMREVLDAFGDAHVDSVVLCFGSQTSKTTTLMAGLTWSIVNEPRPALYVLPNDNLARSFSRSRWQPFVEESPIVALEVPEDVDDFTTLEQRFRRCTLTFTGSNSPANLSSRPVGLLIADELDKFAPPTKREASALDLCEQRLKAFSGSKLFLASTPTTADAEIWQRFLRGDQRRFHVPCPSCAYEQPLEWRQVIWSQSARDASGEWILPQVQASARYKCVRCGHLMDDTEKIIAVTKGRWKPENPNALSGERSYTLSSIYSPDRKCTLGSLAVRFIQANQSMLGLQGFVNGDLAQAWENQSSQIERVELVADADAPALADSISLMTVDVQAKSPNFWWLVRSWDRVGNSRLVAAGHADDWDTLRRIQTHLGVADYRVYVDSGFRPSEVYNECLRWSKRVTPVNSMPLSVGWTPTKSRDRNLVWTDAIGKRPAPYFFGRAALPPDQRVHLPLLEFNADYMRDLLARLRRGPEVSMGLRWEIVQLPVELGIDGAREASEEVYFRHLDSYVQRTVASGRTARVQTRWMPRTQKAADHLLDLELMQLVGAMAQKRFGIAPKVASHPAAAKTVAQPA
jgi:hypothetical protein